MVISLPEFYEKLCERLNSRLPWKQGERTKAFLKEVKALANPDTDPEEEYMAIDLVWRTKDQVPHIELAFEHENDERPPFLEKEIQHLLDLNADNKVAVTYLPNYYEEKNEQELVTSIKKKMLGHTRKDRQENWLILLLQSKWKEGVPGARLKAFFLNGVGEEINQPMESVIYKA